MSIDIKDLHVGILAKYRPDLYRCLIQAGMKYQQEEYELQEKRRARQLAKAVVARR
jgi:hypothetical protein